MCVLYVCAYITMCGTVSTMPGLYLFNINLISPPPLSHHLATSLILLPLLSHHCPHLAVPLVLPLPSSCHPPCLTATLSFHPPYLAASLISSLSLPLLSCCPPYLASPLVSLAPLSCLSCHCPCLDMHGKTHGVTHTCALT